MDHKQDKKHENDTLETTKLIRMGCTCGQNNCKAERSKKRPKCEMMSQRFSAQALGDVVLALTAQVLACGRGCKANQSELHLQTCFRTCNKVSIALNKQT